MRALHLLGSALWRLQASHLAVFVLVPVLAAGARIAFGLLFLPFLLTGFGDRATGGGTELAHLRDPACWVLLAPCPFADSALVELPQADAPEPGAAEAERAPEPFLPAPSAFTVRHAWLVLWLLWFAAFLARRAPRAKDH